MPYVNYDRLVAIVDTQFSTEVINYAGDYQYIYLESKEYRFKYDILGHQVECQNKHTKEWNSVYSLTAEEAYLVGLK
ncbi:hypothetical protein CEW46_29730 [Bacillus cereus]|nr:hypothetical protein CEW46_29730 [Bacillus cereus]